LNSKIIRITLGMIGLIFFLFSLVILGIDIRSFRSQNTIYPAGIAVNDVSLAGLDRSAALERLELAYSQPLELRYKGARIQFTPAELGFSVQYAETLDTLESNIQTVGYWSHLWNQTSQINVDATLQASLNEDQLHTFLQDQIVPRYDEPASASLPLLYTTNFQLGQAGNKLDIERAIPLIKTALFSSQERIIELPVQEAPAKPLDIRNLEIFLKQTIALEGFQGLVEIYIHDLSNEKNLHFAIMDNQPVTPDVAFSAASTIKIPIMVSTFKRSSEPTRAYIQYLLERMIVYSENPPADTLMANVIDEVRGPLIVTEDMQSLGYENTFLAGYFYLGAPVLKLYPTPANTRSDVNLDADDYNQTVASEIGDLLGQIYTCANPQAKNSQITNVFQGEVSQQECQSILELLGANKIGLLIEGGLPPQASIVHKHGWAPELDGLLHSMSDVGIVYTPAGDYVLAIFIYTPQQLIFDEGNWLFARLSQTIYNAFNLEDQAYWWIE